MKNDNQHITLPEILISSLGAFKNRVDKFVDSTTGFLVIIITTILICTFLIVQVYQ